MALKLDSKQARLRLAVYAVGRLSKSEEEPWGMRHLFSPLTDDDQEDPELAKQARGKSWRRTFIQRLIDADLVEKVSNNGAVAYEGVDQAILREMVEETDDEDHPGQTVKHFLLPQYYDPSPGLRARIYPDNFIHDDGETEEEKKATAKDEVEEDEEEESSGDPMAELIGFQVTLLSTAQELLGEVKKVREDQATLLTEVGQCKSRLGLVETSVSDIKRSGSAMQKAAIAVMGIKEAVDDLTSKVIGFHKILKLDECVRKMKDSLLGLKDRYSILGGSVTSLQTGLEKQHSSLNAAIELTLEAIDDNQDTSRRVKR